MCPLNVQEVFRRAPTNIRIDKIIDELTDDGSQANAVFLKVVSERLKQSVAGLQHVNQVRGGLVVCHVDSAQN
jgi:ribosomal protein L18E